MLRRWLWVVARSIAVGWAVLVVLTYLAERPLLFLAGPVVGAHWVETVGLTLDCLKLAATGWAIGRVHRAAPQIPTICPGRQDARRHLAPES